MNRLQKKKENSIKKIVIVLVLGLFTIASATCLVAFESPPGPPPHGGAFFGGLPGPPPGPPPHGGAFFGGLPGPPPGPPPHGDFPNLLYAPPDLIERLKLTDDQMKQMRLAYADFQDRTRKTRNGLMGLNDEKRVMLISGKIEAGKLAKLDEDITRLASEVMAEGLKMKREQLAKLTPEQVDRLADFLVKRPKPHAKMMPK